MGAEAEMWLKRRVEELEAENARLIAQVQRHLVDLSLINELGALVTQHLSLDEVLASGVRLLARVADLPRVILLLVQPGTRKMRVAATTADQALYDDFQIDLDQPSASTNAIRERRPIVIENAEQDPRGSPSIAARFGTQSLVAVPLFFRNEPIGAVVLTESRRRRTFGGPELDRITAICNQLAIAISNARLLDEARRTNSSLERAQRELVKRERLAALGELAAVVAHEVRNPLAVIFNSLTSIRRLSPPGPDAAALLEIVGEEADRLNRMVGDLLDFARPNEPSLQPERLEEVVAGALEVAVTAMADDSVRLETNVPLDLPAVRADARLLRQALINLVVNAIQASPKGGRVRLEGKAERDGDQDVARIEVIDEGPGIPADVADHIFQPFFTTKAKGTGLGLAVVKRIVDAHRGDIGFRSVAGRGTTFTIWLPFQAG